MMVSGGLSISGPKARRMLSRLHSRSGKKSYVTCGRHHRTAHFAASTLQDLCNVVELTAKLRLVELAKKDIDLTSIGDVYGYVDSAGRTHKGVAHKVVSAGEFGGKVASDIHDVIQRHVARREYESAQAGKFKLTENSPNTARITVGPDQRERRKKYVWERVGVQRKIAAGALTVAAVGGGLLHGKLRAAGGGDAVIGAKNLLKRAVVATRNTVSKAVGGSEVAKFVAEKGPIEKMAETAAYGVAQAEKKNKAVASRVATRLTKYGEKPVMVPELHPMDHPDVSLRGTPTGKKKLVRRPAKDPKVIGEIGHSTA